MPLSPREFNALPDLDQKVDEIYGCLLDGVTEFKDLRDQVDGVRGDLEVHVADPNAHIQPINRDDRRYFGDPEEYFTDGWMRFGTNPLTPRQKGAAGGGIAGAVVMIIYVLHDLGVI